MLENIINAGMNEIVAKEITLTLAITVIMAIELSREILWQP
jgi:hypothetical protein